LVASSRSQCSQIGRSNFLRRARSASACVRRSGCARVRPRAVPCFDPAPSPCGVPHSAHGRSRSVGSRAQNKVTQACHPPSMNSAHPCTRARSSPRPTSGWSLIRQCRQTVRRRGSPGGGGSSAGASAKMTVNPESVGRLEFGSGSCVTAVIGARTPPPPPPLDRVLPSWASLEENWFVGVGGQPGTSACRPWPTAPSP
jgi:hypothetical protein